MDVQPSSVPLVFPAHICWLLSRCYSASEGARGAEEQRGMRGRGAGREKGQLPVGSVSPEAELSPVVLRLWGFSFMPT